jgi:hypothetical protein
MAQTPDGIAQIIRREDWRREMAAFDAESSRRLLQAYENIQPEIEAAANRLVQATVLGISPSDFVSLPEYIDFLATVNAEMSSFSRILGTEIDAAADAGTIAGLNASENMVGVIVGGSPQQMGIWVRPDPAAVRRAVGYADSDAMRGALFRFGENASNNIRDLLISGVAQGRNPRQIAAIIADWTNVPYSWAENMSRTTQLYSARTATHEGYLANPAVVTGWMWLSAKDNRTCISCWSKDGLIFPVTQILNDHHRGRCTPAPITRASRWNVGYELGRERFMSLTEQQQREIFHNDALYNEWRRGRVQWDELSEPYQNDIFGEMQRAPSLASIERRREEERRRNGG